MNENIVETAIQKNPLVSEATQKESLKIRPYVEFLKTYMPNLVHLAPRHLLNPIQIETPIKKEVSNEILKDVNQIKEKVDLIYEDDSLDQKLWKSLIKNQKEIQS